MSALSETIRARNLETVLAAVPSGGAGVYDIWRRVGLGSKFTTRNHLLELIAAGRLVRSHKPHRGGTIAIFRRPHDEEAKREDAGRVQENEKGQGKTEGEGGAGAVQGERRPQG